jgi:hypothetical protein
MLFYLCFNSGELADPYKEFMVVEDTSLTKEALEEDFNARFGLFLFLSLNGSKNQQFVVFRPQFY